MICESAYLWILHTLCEWNRICPFANLRRHFSNASTSIFIDIRNLSNIISEQWSLKSLSRFPAVYKFTKRNWTTKSVFFKLALPGCVVFNSQNFPATMVFAENSGRGSLPIWRVLRLGKNELGHHNKWEASRIKLDRNEVKSIQRERQQKILIEDRSIFLKKIKNKANKSSAFQDNVCLCI